MIKRLFDIIFSFLVIVFVLSWLTPIIAFIIFLDSKNYVFYTQERAGKNGKSFHIIKFRSMKGAPPKNDPLLSKEEATRITNFGAILRKYRIDELPQFINVLKGEMSIVGPRPERHYFLSNIVKHIPKYAHLQKLRPGITSLGQTHYGYANNLAQMKSRARYDLIYLDNLSLWTDIKIILFTLVVVFQGKGR